MVVRPCQAGVAEVTRALRRSELIMLKMVMSTGDVLASIWRSGLPRRSVASFAFAACCVLAATSVHIAIGFVSTEAVVFAPYYSATLIAALVGGWEAGTLALAVGGLVAARLFVPSELSLATLTRESLSGWILYGISSATIILAASSYRHVLQQLREEQQKRRLLHHELSHRMKNTLANVQAIVALALGDQRELVATISDRIAALAATNNLLMQSEWRSASLRAILASELKPYDPSRIHLAGEDLQCAPDAALILAMLVHELATNAAKHGALSHAAGKIDISWHQRERRLHVSWIEHSELKINIPLRKGFGTMLLQAGLEQFQGRVERKFEPTGLQCRFSLVLPAPQSDAAQPQQGARAA